MAALNTKQKRFAQEYLIDLNATAAAIRAGYAKTTAYSQGHRLLKHDECAAYIEKLKQERSQKTAIDAAYVLKALHDMHTLDVMDILTNDLTLKPLSEWPKAWRTSISAVDVAEMFERDGDVKALSGYIKKIKMPDKTKVLELMGRHVSVQAWQDKLEVSGELALGERMKKARERSKD